MEDLTHLTDADIVEKSLENPDNFRHVIERYSSPLSRYIKRRAKVNSHDVDDILQDVFIKTYRNLNDYDRSLSFSSWIYRIAHNTIIDWYRKEKKHSIVELDAEDSSLIMAIAGEEFADTSSQREDIKKEINQALDSLGNDYKDVVVLRYFEDKSYEEISDIMRIPVSLVGARLTRAKNMIKKKLLANTKK